jgi:glycosyltransferase involved in cell wall biosynthesis
MRVLQIAALASAHGAYGGPLRVAINQSRELRTRGHEVVLAAGWDGRESSLTALDGVPVRLFRALQAVPQAGFSGLVTPGLWSWLRRNLSAFNVVHLHLGRDMITSIAGLLVQRSRIPYVTQTHGMVMVDGRPKSRAFDVLLMHRLLHHAGALLALTRDEERDLQEIAGPAAKVLQLPNGVPIPSAIDACEDGRDAQVLFCARLHPRKRVVAFAEMAAILVARGIRARYHVVGPDEGTLADLHAAVERLDLGNVLSYEGALDYDAVISRVSRATVYVLPSVNEPFPMSLLEALSAGVPSVCTSSCGIGDILWERRAAMVTNGTPEALATAVEALLKDVGLRQQFSQRGRDAIAEYFSIQSVAQRLEGIYGMVGPHQVQNEAS